MTDQPRLSERLRDARSAPMLAHFYAETARIIPELQALEAREERLTAAVREYATGPNYRHERSWNPEDGDFCSDCEQDWPCSEARLRALAEPQEAQ